MYICLNRATTGGKLPFDQFVQLAADAGFGGADVDLKWARAGSVAAMRDLFASRNLRFGGWGIPYDWRGEPSSLTTGLKDLDELAGIARQLGIDSCATWIMPSSDLRFTDNWHFHVQRLRPAAEVLGGHGLRLGLEFVAPYHLRKHFRHEFIFTPGQMLELAAEVGPNVGLLVDAFHVHASGTPWKEIERIPQQEIVLVHLNDAPAAALPDLVDDQRLLPGEGALDLPGFVHALKSAGYDGPVSLEVFNDDLKKLDPPQAARRAWLATAKCLQGVALE